MPRRSFLHLLHLTLLVLSSISTCGNPNRTPARRPVAQAPHLLHNQAGSGLDSPRYNSYTMPLGGVPRRGR